ncbi:MAG TPA: hypothetical protein VMU81_05400 [Acetobacteraceae bacterium]|nr:hypothetical protein [Acetobacteraceae bacterium]
MPDLPVECATPGRYPADMESCVVVLEQIARETTASFGRIERRLAGRLYNIARRHRGQSRRDGA